MRILIVIGLLLNMFAYGNAAINDNKIVSEYLEELNNLDYDQRVFLMEAVAYGKSVGFENTLPAIAWRESGFNKNVINLSDGSKTKYPGSYGPYQILLHNFMKIKNLEGKGAASKEAEKLVRDMAYSREQAKEMLLYWKNYWSKQKVDNWYLRMIGSYNAGNASIDSDKGLAYAEDVVIRAKVLKDWLASTKTSGVVKITKTKEI